jgi:glucose/arabinose dehydrogenase
MLGDDLPPEEINQVNQSGDHFGYPFIHAGVMKDPRLGHEYNASDFTSPEIKIQAHSAPLGLVFYDGNQFPDRFQNALFIAEHGSWNRSSKVGYQVSVVMANQNTAIPFISGWLQDEKVFGRPSDLIVSFDGSLLLADDLSGSIYKVSYSSKKDE